MATSTDTSLFVNSPGKARASIPAHGASNDTGMAPGCRASSAGGFLSAEAENPVFSQTRETKTKRDFDKSIYSKFNLSPNEREADSHCSTSSFQSFKNRFSDSRQSNYIGRPFSALSAKLASHHVRPRNLEHNMGLQTRVLFSPRTKQNQTISTFLANRLKQNRHRNCRSLEKRSFERCKAGFRPVCKQLVPGAETGRQFSTCHKPKRFKRIPSIRPFQNGGDSPLTRFATVSRLAGQNRSKGCVFRDTNLEGSQEVSPICLEEHAPRVRVSSLWSGSCSQAIHKSYETSGCTSSKVGNSVDNLPRRPFVYEPVPGRPKARHVHSAVSVGEFGFRHKFRKILSRSNSAVGVSRVRSKHSGYDSAPSRLQGRVDKKALFRCVSASRSFGQGVISTDWQVDHVYPGDLPCPSALPSPPTSKTPSPRSAEELRCDYSPVERGQRGAQMVVSSPRCLERSGATTALSRSGNRNRRFENRLGCGMPRGDNRGIVVTNGEQAPHKLFRASSRILYSQELHKGSIMCPCETSNGQHFGSSLCEPAWGDTLPGSLQSGPCPVGMGSESQYFSQWRTPFRLPECHGGLAVSPLHRFQQLAVMPDGVPLTDANSGPLCKGSVCGQIKCPVVSVFQLETRPDGISLGCSSTRLVHREKLCVSPILPHNTNAREIERERGGINLSDSSVAHSGLVSQLVGHVGVPPRSSTSDPESPSRSAGRDTSSNCEPNSSFGRVACIKQSLQSKGICADASELILAAWRPGTNAVYNSAWKKWHSWCVGREIDSFCPSLADITSFLAQSFSEGLEYRTINTYRSALSGVLPPIDGFPLAYTRW